jgi:ubiquinol-cytochrome c reductase cytochrome b subunit
MMAAAIAIMFVLPWLDRSPVKSIRYKGAVPRLMILLFAASFIILGVLGVKSPTTARTLLAQVNTTVYFAFFLTMPIWSNPYPTKPLLRKIGCWIFAAGFVALAFSNYGNIVKDHLTVVVIYTLVLAALFAIMPFWVAKDYVKPEPERITMDGGMGFWKTLGAVVIVALLSVIPLKAVGAESAFKCGTMECDEVNIDFTDKASLQSGAATYMNYCMGCHSLKYSRYERVANDLGIPVELALENFIFDDTKVGALMENSMPQKAAKRWFGAAPPDLSLMSRARQPEWLYTYLRNFYVDQSRPYGVNNRVFKDVGMPHVMLDLQGYTECGPGPVKAANGGIKRDIITGEPILEGECGQLNIVKEGTMSADEFDTTIRDLVNFMAYVAEPMALDRKRIGIYTMFFLVVLLVFALLLNREYWKDVH